jgi:tripeptidyl-peptidase-1
MGSARLGHRLDIKQEKRAARNHKHQITFAIKQKNLKELEKTLYDVSDHRSANYGKHWTREAVAALTANPASSSHVEKFLVGHGIKVVSKTLNEEYITAEAPVAQWEKILGAKFYEFVQEDNKDVKIVRASEFSISKCLVEHLTYVYNVVDFPSSQPMSVNEVLPQRLERAAKVAASDPVFIPGYVTPALLNQYYWIDSNTGSQLASQAVYESINQTYSPSDLTYFQEQFNLPVEAMAVDIGGHEWDEACVADAGNNCGEVRVRICVSV